MICKCGKCGKENEIVCLVNEIPYCEDCFLAALEDCREREPLERK